VSQTAVVADDSPETSVDTLSGWGRTAAVRSTVARPGDTAELEAMLATAANGVIARGLGRSYGDAAQCSGGLTLDITGFSEIGTLDAATGTIEVGAGASLHDLMGRVIPAGWFVAVTPGTRYVTVGGAIAADVHGKNHHRDGSFARHVAEMTLVTPTGTVTVSPERDPELFWATSGGMGMTGVVTSATLRLTPIETSWMEVDSTRFTRLEDVMATMESSDDQYRYSVAWLDCLVRRDGGVRSVLTRGDHAPLRALPDRLRGRSREAPAGPKIRVPRPPPGRLVNRASVRALNEAWFRASSTAQGDIRPLTSFFHPLDGVASWNLLYGPAGFVQYQFVVPPERGDIVEEAVGAIATSGLPSFLAVLKRFGPGTPGPLSFSQQGWTLALDFPLGPAGLPALLDRLDESVTGSGGRVYLAKDARLRPELVAEMYPRLGELQAVARRVDPEAVLASDQSRRLGLLQ
jgi:decaprenylphospho-beta-D-ribofuranose 2-oxidase